jgi:predicted transcriptional regulator
MKPTTYNLPDELTDRIGQVARDSERSRSFVVRKLLEQSLTGADRLRALEAVAAEGLAEFAAEHARERGPNPGQIIAASSTEGHARLRAFDEIAAGNRKAAK